MKKIANVLSMFLSKFNLKQTNHFHRSVAAVLNKLKIKLILINFKALLVAPHCLLAIIF